jgi:hypothetical protein
MQRLNQRTTIEEVEQDNTKDIFGYVALVMLACIVLTTGITIKQCTKLSDKPQLDCQQCHSRKQAMTEYFRKNGSRSPEQMAEAVLNTKSPRLLAAIAKVETGGNPHIRNTGYKKRHSGAFQVNPKYWGNVPYNPAEQALQSERILAELTNDYPLRKALSVYGGDSTDRYQRTVLAELQRVP